MDPTLHRTPGTAVFLNAGKTTTPLAMRANVEHNRTLHQDAVILSLETLKVPHVPVGRAADQVDDLGYDDDGIVHVTARLGLPGRARRSGAGAAAADEADRRVRHRRRRAAPTSSPTSRSCAPMRRGWRTWRKRLFLGTSRLSSNPVEYFGLPLERTVTMGQHIDF